MMFRNDVMDKDELKKKWGVREKEERGISYHLHKHVAGARVVVIFLVIVLLFVSCAILKTPKKTDERSEACFKHDVCLELIIAETEEELETGLSKYTTLEENKAMLFKFPKAGVVKVWAKEMKFPIDIIWLNEGERVVHIEEAVLPCTQQVCDIFEPPVSSKYIIELNSGFAKELNIFKGDKVQLKLVD
jgi:uncharacterized membrane protein (UPF0127 family)